MNKLTPNDSVVIEQLFESIKVYVKQFKKTPNLRLAVLTKTTCTVLIKRMDKYIDYWIKQNSRKIKINGDSK